MPYCHVINVLAYWYTHYSYYSIWFSYCKWRHQNCEQRLPANSWFTIFELSIEKKSSCAECHENPKIFPIKNRVQIAAHVNIGNFELDAAAKSEIMNFIDITSDTRPDDPSIKMHSGLYYHCTDVFNPEIGDIRLQFTTAGIEGNYVRISFETNSVLICNFLISFLFAVHNRWTVWERPNRSIRN